MNKKLAACFLCLILFASVTAAGCTTTGISENTAAVSPSNEDYIKNYQNEGHSVNPYMLLAVEEANKGIENGDGGPFGCVIVKDGVVVGKGHNCVVKNNDPTAHGEIMAIRDAGQNLKTFDLSGCDLYTTGEPCPMCMAAILWAKIENVYYGCTLEDNASLGFKDEVFYYELAAMENTGVEVNRDLCLLLFDKYKNMKDKIIY